MLYIIFYFLIYTKQDETLKSLVDKFYDNLSAKEEIAVMSVKNFLFLTSQLNDIVNLAIFNNLMTSEELNELEKIQRFIHDSYAYFPYIIRKNSKNVKERWERVWISFQKNIKTKEKQYKNIYTFIKILEHNINYWLKINNSLTNMTDISDFYSKSLLNIFQSFKENSKDNIEKYTCKSFNNFIEKCNILDDILIKYENMNKSVQDLFCCISRDVKDISKYDKIFLMKIINAILKRSLYDTTMKNKSSKREEFDQKLSKCFGKSFYKCNLTTNRKIEMQNNIKKNILKFFIQIIDELEGLN
ncbi:hypothetical protein H312_01795 [Anncaliia algerae PRA339]|uniref:Uncharacterized protein n=1 Tax=Anncaliia algerae PRA339 TaxID=1288291 RepID=A0A059F0F7_9MICR|nr:hypothetical protein H312_01795 [Anncaliia algerae PRA339]